MTKSPSEVAGMMWSKVHELRRLFEEHGYPPAEARTVATHVMFEGEQAVDFFAAALRRCEHDRKQFEAMRAALLG
jgi:hypothetical protein